MSADARVRPAAAQACCTTCAGAQQQQRWRSRRLHQRGQMVTRLVLCVCLSLWTGAPVAPLAPHAGPAGGAREAQSRAGGAGSAGERALLRRLLPRIMGGRAAALRLSGGFDKIADDDPEYEELHDLLDAYDGEGAPLTLKEKMQRQVEHTTECLERMSHIVGRAAERATLHVAQEGDEEEGEEEEGEGDFHNSLDGSSGQGADDGFEGGLDDYFEYVSEKEPGTRDDRGRPELVLGAEMLRQPMGMPPKMRQGKTKYVQGAMEFVKQVEEGTRQWGKLNVLGNPVYQKKHPVTDMMGFDELPEDIEYRIDGQVVTRRQYKKHRKALKRSRAQVLGTAACPAHDVSVTCGALFARYTASTSPLYAKHS